MTRQQAKLAALGIYDEISDRRGLRQELEDIDEETKEEMIEAWVNIIMSYGM